jgi:hypothetical protein
MESSRIKLFPAKSSFIAYHAPRGAVDFVDASICRGVLIKRDNSPICR